MTRTRIALGATAAIAFAATGAAWLAADAPRDNQSVGTASSLPVASDLPMTGYDRAAFRHWTSHGNGCSTRELVLRRTAETGSYRTDNECRAVTGTWTDPYTGRTWPQSSDVDIDHVVPLAEAWRSGASTWTPEQREAFANDLTRPQLLAVEDNLNQAKGDRDPGSWLPPNEQCRYVDDWTAVKRHYGLFADPAEAEALARVSASCDEGGAS